MSFALLPLVLTVAAVTAVTAIHSHLLPTQTQLPDFAEATEGPVEVLKAGGGAPVDVRHTKTLNSNLITNEWFMEELEGLVQSRIAERAVHSLGVSGIGYFEVTNDITKYCKAKVFSKIGKKTPVIVRMSLTRSRQGSPDTTQGSRGCAFKYYTEDGNYDMTGFGVPISPSRDPVNFVAAIKTLSGNPATNIFDANMRWDFITQNPEAILKSLHEYSDYGAPATYKDMPCYVAHTYQVYNEEGVSSFMRFNLIPCKGPKFLNGTEVSKLTAGDPTYYTKDYYNSIATGDYPCYILYGQILSLEDVENADMDVFDISKILDEKQYPYIEIGRVIVNKNVENYFQQSEILAFSPANVVKGILGSPDKVYETRCLAYRESQTYRLGSNYKNIPVNCPINGPVHNYVRGGLPPNNPNAGGGPIYYPNMFKGPEPIEEKNRPEMIKIHEQPPDNFEQGSNFYSNVLTPAQRTTLINNMVKDISQCTEDIQEKAIKHFKVIHPDLAKRVAKALELSV